MLGTRLLEMVTWNPDLFKGIVLPPKMVQANLTQTVIDTIMKEHYNHVCLYEEPAFFKQCIDLFFQQHLIEFTKLYDTVIVEYNPIENYDRYEDSHRVVKGDDNYNDANTGGYTDTNGGSDITTNQVSAMNDTGFQNDSKSTTTLGSSMTRDNHINLAHDESYSNDDTYHARTHGNIGVTTTQQMLEQERRIAEFNIFFHISNKFFEELMVQVYD